ILRSAPPIVSTATVQDEAAPVSSTIATTEVLRSSTLPGESSVARSHAREQTLKPAPLLRASTLAIASWTRSARLAALFPGLVMAWGMGVLALSIRLLGGWWLVRRLRRSVANAPLPEWQPRLEALSRRMREVRGLCCDDLAVSVAGDPVIYAEALCRLERMRGTELALAATGGSLLARVKRLLAPPSSDHEFRSRGLGAVLGFVAVV